MLCFLQGNLDFVEAGEAVKILDSDLLQQISTLLSCDLQETEKALCSRVVAARGEVMEKGHTLEQAQYGRDAFAKVSSRQKLF